MIFIAGVQPKTTVLDQTPRLCPVCGLARARRQRLDHWFSLFFIPVVRVKKGTDFLFCDRCGRPVTEGSTGADAVPHDESPTCNGCGHALENDHRFCPYCGLPRG